MKRERNKQRYRKPALIATGMARAHSAVAGPCSVCRSSGHLARRWEPGVVLIVEVGEMLTPAVVLCDGCMGRVERACLP